MGASDLDLASLRWGAPEATDGAKRQVARVWAPTYYLNVELRIAAWVGCCALVFGGACADDGGAGMGGDEVSGETVGTDSEGESGTDSGTDSSTDSGTETGTEDAESTDAGSETTETDTETGTEDSGGNLKPADAPDWVVVTVSGHCIPPGCAVPGANNEYLADTGTAQRFVDLLEVWGYSVELFSYSDEFYNRDNSAAVLQPGQGAPTIFGFLQMFEDLTMIRDEWVADFDDPTRILLVAHSHGVVWSHSALMAFPDLPVEIVIDFDGKSLAWEDEDVLLEFGDTWQSVIAAYTQAEGINWGFNLGAAEASWPVPGLPLQDLEDVVPAWVGTNIELQATSGLIMPFPDNDDNHRLDGSTDGIVRFESQSEDHVEIDNPDSQAVDWAIGQVAELLGG